MASDERRVSQLESFHDCERLYDETNVYGKMNYADVGFLTARKLIPQLLAERDAAMDDLLGLAMAVANGWPNDTAPAHIREEYIEALREMARELTETHAERVAILRARNASEVCPKCGHDLVSSWRPNDAAYYCHGCGWHGD